MSVTITEVRNAVSKNTENTRFYVEINHPEQGWIPYTLNPEDTDMTINNDDLIKLIGSNFSAFSQSDADAETAVIVRVRRDALLEGQVDRMVSNPLRWATLTTTQQNAWTQYRTDLLNVPQQDGFPNSVIWPSMPS